MRRKRLEFTDLVKALGCEARRLAQPVQVLGCVFLFVALLLWLLLFYSYSFDSFKSLALCVAFLAFVLTPGVVFLWLSSSLRQLALLPDLLPRVEEPQSMASESEEVDEVEEAADSTHAAGRLGRFRARIDEVLVLWEHLSFSKNELQQLTGPSRSFALIAHPAAVFLVATALLIGAFVGLGTVIAILARLVSWVF